MSGPGDSDLVLVLNAGSSSIKLAVFDGALTQILTGIADGIGGPGTLKLGHVKTTQAFPDHATALHVILQVLENQGFPISRFAAAAHRVVHGGTALTQPTRITPEVLSAIKACTPLAPLHNPHNIAAIETLAALAPDLPQVACFDTAFHASNPEVATRYALPPRIEARGIRRYGFHGISYASLIDSLPALTGTPLPARLLAFHLGNGASICAIRDGKSISTSMGYSPLEGLTMGTRTGMIDGNAVLRLAEEDGIAATHHLLNKESGLRGLSGGLSDMRALLADPSQASAFAVEHFCYWAIRHAGSLIAAMQGLDAVAFTGGIGENAAPVRARIMDGLAWLGAQIDARANATGETRLHAPSSGIACWIIPAQEERMIAGGAQRLLSR
ncbi:MAG: acetate kinase [Roseovarius sp. BRH_c41]|uniref:acetate/propionate family kinase n=1 Tax=Roseovarius sp. BRH_c41 TaxID=1629709 RepID=UPI0005F0C75F|nr:acetate/propionate family kinase [Roseovarius sp. BRH_c41]KJS40648.1 MAG: acetate kinase [Roseovarius sp. BRH_c41]